MNVVVIKTLGGEEILAELESISSEGDYTVTRPRILMVSGQNIGLVPYLISVPDANNIRIKAHSIVTAVDAPHEIASQYIKTVTTLILG